MEPSTADVVRIAARYRPGGGSAVGGDWYDIVRRSNGEVVLAIGDVAGHGVTAAATMVRLRDALHADLVDETGPAAALTLLSTFTMAMLPSEMATALVVVLDPAGAQVGLASAGHIPPLICSGGICGYAEVTRAPALGLPRTAEVEEAVLALLPGTTMVCFTDGLVERRDDPIDVGLARLQQIVAEGSSDVDELCDQVMTLADPGPDADDVTVLAVRLP